MQLCTACRETVLALPPRAAHVQCSRFGNQKSIPWQKVLFTKYLILCSLGLLWFSPLSSELLKGPIRAARQSSEQREAPDGKRCSHTAHPSRAWCQWQPCQCHFSVTSVSLETCSALCQGAPAVLPPGQSSQIPHPTPRPLVSFSSVACREQEHKVHFLSSLFLRRGLLGKQGKSPLSP